ncbi:MAG: LPS-assembly protein LptD [Ectothiorhodospiraceae bacterium]|nr:LPS-assembly protein LptD [Ectothiorhodospiraceae bacterium]
MIRATRTSMLLLLALPAALTTPQARADGLQWPLLSGENGKWAACIDYPDRPTMQAPSAERQDPDTPSRIDADFMRYRGESGTYSFTGNVELERADQRIRADEMLYSMRENRVDTRGNLQYEEPSLRLGGEQGYFLLDRNQGELDQARYLVPETLAQGEAGKIRITGPQVTELERATYSTCEPGNELWQLRVSDLRLNRETGVGEAWHARLAIKGVPVAYVPYANFPIDDRRKSGFLPPTFRVSDRNGTDLMVPYYWNIAPNYDATLAPRYMSQRGLMMDGEFRYLQSWQEGEVRGTYLPDDDQREEDRWGFFWDHRANLLPGLSAQLNLNRVSDDEYFRDFGSDYTSSSVSQLSSQARLRYRRGNVTTGLRAQVFQNLNPNLQPQNRSYEQLPQATLSHTPFPAPAGPVTLDYRLDAEAVRFDHPAPDLRDTGVRMDLTPRLSLPYQRQAGYIRPGLALRMTQYDLDRIEDGNADADITRVTPIATLDTGIFLERHFDAFDRPLRQTLEPRLYYLYVPYRDQDDIPLFDTNRADPSMFQFFSENRFIGADRMGDANQVAVGLTSRFLNRRDGREYFRAGIAQVFYFDDRQVQLRPNEPVDETRRSDIIGELRATLPAGLTASTELQWDPNEEETTFAAARLNYRPRADAVISSAYRTRVDNGERTLEQRDIAVVWPVAQRWHLIGGWRYSMLDDRTLEQFGGLQYRDCCWTTRLVSRYYRDDFDDEPERSIMLQVEFRGLGRLGDQVEEFLQDTIYGYERTR